MKTVTEIRDELVAKARAMGVTVEEHAAAEIAKVGADWWKICSGISVLAFFVGVIIGTRIHA